MNETAGQITPLKRIGEILMETCGLSAEALTRALELQQQRGGRIGGILLAEKAIQEKDLLAALGVQFDLPVLRELPPLQPGSGFTEKVPIQFLRRFKLVPLPGPDGGRIAVHDPLLFQPLDDLRRLLELEHAEVVLCEERLILSAIHRAYDRSRDTAERVMQDMQGEEGERVLSEIQQADDLLDEASDAPVIKLVNLILSQAARDRASDIHIEPQQNQLKVRYRVDGILYDLLAPPRHVQSRLISRVKIMARLDIAEKRLPQDGRIEIRLGERNIDIRVATLPTAFGERVVLRLLDKSKSLLRLPDLGMGPGLLGEFDRLIRLAHGIVLVTGPTGSGKTTTLYGALGTLNRPEINIITIEDPIEYQIDGVGQIQVNPKIGLTFASGLRSIVRQDPDVILVGEIRDRETAEIAIHSALTGHLVFSTLHTNDSASTVTRLIDMGIEPYLVSSAVVGILAQRLVRTLCPHCREPLRAGDPFPGHPGLPAEKVAGRTLYGPRGCAACLQTGYRGRTGIFELMVLDDGLRDLIARTADAKRIQQQARAQGMASLSEDGLQKVLEGLTTPEEIFRVTQV